MEDWEKQTARAQAPAHRRAGLSVAALAAVAITATAVGGLVLGRPRALLQLPQRRAHLASDAFGAPTSKLEYFANLGYKNAEKCDGSIPTAQQSPVAIELGDVGDIGNVVLERLPPVGWVQNNTLNGLYRQQFLKSPLYGDLYNKYTRTLTFENMWQHEDAGHQRRQRRARRKGVCLGQQVRHERGRRAHHLRRRQVCPGPLCAQDSQVLLLEFAAGFRVSDLGCSAQRLVPPPCIAPQLYSAASLDRGRARTGG